MFEFDIEKFDEAFGIPKSEKEIELPINPFEYLQTKWLAAKLSLPQRTLRFLTWYSYNPLVAQKEDVIKALRIAYNCGLEKRSMHEINKTKEQEMIL